MYYWYCLLWGFPSLPCPSPILSHPFRSFPAINVPSTLFRYLSVTFLAFLSLHLLFLPPFPSLSYLFHDSSSTLVPSYALSVPSLAFPFPFPPLQSFRTHTREGYFKVALHMISSAAQEMRESIRAVIMKQPWLLVSEEALRISAKSRILGQMQVAS